MKQIIFALFSMLIAISYSCKPTALEESTIMKEEADIYIDYVNKYYITQRWVDFNNKPFNTIVILEKTAVLYPYYTQGISRLSVKPDKDTVNNFLKRIGPPLLKSEYNQRFKGRYPLNPLIKFNLSHTLISIEALTQIFNEGEYREFFRNYPSSRGLVQLSRVGFNSNMDQGLFIFAQAWSEGASEIFLILYEKRDGEWDMVSRHAVSIS